MSANADRIALGKDLIVSARRLKERLGAFHRWLPDAVNELGESPVVPITQGERVAALDTEFGRIVVVDELTRRNGALVALVVFYRPADEIYMRPQRLYAIELRDDYTAHFDPAERGNEFEVNPRTDAWMPRNVLRLGYELAIACSAPRLDYQVTA